MRVRVGVWVRVGVRVRVKVRVRCGMRAPTKRAVSWLQRAAGARRRGGEALLLKSSAA